jgi:dTDP-glucose 4,6-dehydratase
MSKTILLTGAAGFIGSHMAEHLNRQTDWNIVIIDKLTYASKGLDRLRDAGLIFSPRVRFFSYDLIQPLSVGLIREIGTVDCIVHMAAETHVDNSIVEPARCIENNIISTVNILEYARQLQSLTKFFYFSTDEVFGVAPPGVSFKEWDRHKPTNPYSASKSGAESICISYENTYKIPLIIVNVMNAFGERQHVEKFIPKCIKYILQGQILDIHADLDCKNPGSRTYIHARNIAAAVLFLIDRGKLGEKYNIVGEKEMNNLEVAQFIADELGKECKYRLTSFHKARPGHDLRYSLDGTKLQEMGWNLPISFEDSLRKTINWTLKHKQWLEE